MKRNVMLTPLVARCILRIQGTTMRIEKRNDSDPFGAGKSALATRRFIGNTDQRHALERRRMKAPHLNLLSPLLLGLAALLLAACQTTTPLAHAQEPGALSVQERVQRGKALFDEKCRTVAGEKIYKTVPDVEGVLLLKVRPRVGDREWADKLWPGAAFALEATADDFVNTFLGYEHSSHRTEPVKPSYRGYIGMDYQPDNPSNLPGYSYVDVIDEKDGKRYRISGSEKIVGKKDTTAKGVQMAMEKDVNYDLNIYRWSLDKSSAPGPAPRYAVTYEDHVVPEERALWLASGIVKVIDRQTGEVLGEMTRYAWSAGAPSPANPSPWLTAYKCPGHPVGANAATRKFVDQVLLPKKEK